MDIGRVPQATMKKTSKPVVNGFTLVELLVVISIVAALALLSFIGLSRFIESGRKVQVMAQIRDFQIGMAMFEGDYLKPPVPASKRDSGWDTIYGDPGGNYSTQFLISALAGEDKDFPYKGNETFSAKEANPRQESYMIFKFSPNSKGGVGKDGKLYDPWGNELMVAINGLKSTSSEDTLSPFNGGQNDSRLHTWGLAEYTETKPKEQGYVFWSYGKDQKKGKKGANYWTVVPYTGSDDVISW